MMQSMLKVMEGMQMMQHQILDVRKGKEVEIVKNSVMELPKLPEWKAETAPLDLTDWLLTIEPTMGDLSDGSQQWWDGVLRTSRQWYADHLLKGPLEKVNHRPVLPPELEGPRYQRLEKRATSLLMTAIPQGQQEEVVASKNVSVINILAKLMISYQPGGLSEKCAILTALDSPEEAQNLTQAVHGLRRWLRWHRRAGEVGVVRPDATIQVKGLGRLMKRVLKENGDLAFRIQLSKSSLQIDTAPTESAVLTYANHLMAEVEQIAHQDKKKKDEQKPQKEKEDPRLRRAEENGAPCKFFNTDDGCRKGKLCGWLHTVEGDKKRCWNCGSTAHFSPSCDRPKEPPKEGYSPDKSWKGEGKGASKSSRTLKKDEAGKKEEVGEQDEKGKEEVNPKETVEDLLKEANRMLKGLSAKEDEVDKEPKESRLAAMQRQLDELRKMKTLRLSRIAKEETMFGLLDSGATHPMRGKRPDETLTNYESVMVTLADGSQTQMRMTSQGIMVVEDPNVEPIIPMGLIGGELGYSITWKDHQLRLTHPKKGTIKVQMKAGCPQIPRHLALQMIRELEDRGKVKAMKKDEEDEKAWLEQLVKAHPVLRQLPNHIKEKLPITPSEDLKRLPGSNRRKKKILKEHGMIVNLYAGPRDGYTMERALREVGGDQRRLVEVDLLREDEDGKGSHDMLNDEDGPYATLMRAALDGTMRALIFAPNCRTRSVLRHYPIENGPRPVRSWEEPWGKADNTPEEKTKVREDDLLMWRGWMLYIVQEEMARAMGRPDGRRLRVGLEQPADPTHYMEETVTFWKTKEWQELKRMYGLEEQSFRQSDWGGLAKKPTTFAGNLPLELPEERHQLKKEDFKGSSKDLSRWAPGFMKEVASRLQSVVLGGRLRMKRMSWEEHCQRGHTPFRRDCQICQEASARGRLHQKVKHPRAGVMSLDVSGPYKAGKDVEESSRFMLIGTYVWLRPPDEDPREVKDEEEVPEQREDEEMGEELEEPGEMDEDRNEEVDEEAWPDEPPIREIPEEEERKDPKFEVMKIGIPIRGKTKEAVLEGAIDLYLQLMADGYPVHTIHTDRGKEFINRNFKNWTRARGITHSTNAGEDPMANGRVERAVGEVKRMIRRLLHSSGMAVEWWPMALRYLMEGARLRRRDGDKRIPMFGEKILIKKRNWRTKMMEATHEEAKFLCPMVEAHGQCVLRTNGRWGIISHVIRHVKNPPPPTEEMWLTVVDDDEKDEIQERRRIRAKGPIRRGGDARVLQLRMMIKEQVDYMERDTTETAITMFKRMEPWRGELRRLEEEEQEILQTKIVSPQELVRDVEMWDEAIQKELKAMFQEKDALRRITTEEKRRLEEKGKRTTVVPSKLVITRKAGGRRKVRIVACGNFQEKTEDEDISTGGSDAITFRVALKRAENEGWEGATSDIRVAFLNAPWHSELDMEEEEEIAILKPPHLLVKLGYAEAWEWWQVTKAVYGFRKSPKKWSRHRDHTMQDMRWRTQDQGGWYYMEPTAADPNLWRIKSTEDDRLHGLVLVYVDDLMVFGCGDVIKGCLERVRQVWDLSEPEWLNPQSPVRFLGMDVWKMKEGMFVSQESYIQDVLKRNGEEQGPVSGIPITKDQVSMIEDECPRKEAEGVRMAQKATGELMWLVTRTRPDLMFVLSKMSQATTKNPEAVIEVARQVWKYLRKTKAEGIWIRKEKNEALRYEDQREEEGEEDVIVYTDSSYGPGGLESQGTVLVFYGGALAMWRSGKQSMPSLSTAESELMEAIEGMIMGDSVDAVCGEVHQKTYTKVIRIDNLAALNLLTEPSGSWRTRHLRLKAASLRWRISKMDWLPEPVPGAKQVADVGTKPLTAPRLQELKRMMGMGERKTGEEEGKCEEAKKSEESIQERLEAVGKILKVLTVIELIQGVAAQPSEERDGRAFFNIIMFLAIIGAMSITFMLGILTAWTWNQMRTPDPQKKKEDEPDPQSDDEKIKEWYQTRKSDPQDGKKHENLKESEDEEQREINQQIREWEREEQRRNQFGSTQGSQSYLHVRGSGSSRAAGSEETRDQRQRGSYQRRRPSQGPFITDWGARWHSQRQCPTLQNPSNIHQGTWCEECAPEGTQQDRPVFTIGAGRVAHLDSNCFRAHRGTRRFPKCQICCDQER
eukprot:Skav233709  [mRNA]  locus=scaffold2120:28636:35173:- [translate_table: standard]